MKPTERTQGFENTLTADIALALNGKYDTPDNVITNNQNEVLVNFIFALAVAHSGRMVISRTADGEPTGYVLVSDRSHVKDLLAYHCALVTLVNLLTMSGCDAADFISGLVNQFLIEVDEYHNNGSGPSPGYETARFIAASAISRYMAIPEERRRLESLPEPSEVLRRWLVNNPHQISDRDRRDTVMLRRLLALRSGLSLYSDDGELTSTCRPVIDFMRDTPAEIRRKFVMLSEAKRAKQSTSDSSADQPS